MHSREHETELTRIVSKFINRTHHRHRFVRIHSVADGYLARQTLDGDHFLLVPWHRERPMFETHFALDGDGMTGQRTAWQWRCYCCGKRGVTVIAHTPLSALQRLHEFVNIVIGEHE